jgi:hypothetical protein
MRVRLDQARDGALVGFCYDSDVETELQGRLGIRLGGSVSWNNSLPRITVRMLDTGKEHSVLFYREVEASEEDVLGNKNRVNVPG